VAGVLGAVVLLAGVALLGGAVGRVVGWGGHDRMGFADQRSSDGQRFDGPGRSEDAPGRQKDKPRDGQDRQQGGGADEMPGRGLGRGMGQGPGMLGRDVLHGEFTISPTGTPTVMVVQTGEVTAYTSGRSLSVRSSDGFEATYALDASPATPGEAARLATGAQVRVVAAKEGMKVTRVVVVD
jgi:hypothetical protein